MTAFLLFSGIALVVGFLAVRYGADSRVDGRQL